MTTLRVRSLSREAAAGTAALRDVSFDVEDWRITGLFGPRGAGKTAVLRAIAGLDGVDGGEVLIDERSLAGVPPDRRGVAMMFQPPVLFDRLDVRENVALGLRTRKWPANDRERRVDELLDAFALGGEEHASVNELDEDRRCRAAIAQALAPHPALVLFDEPLATLDRPARRWLRRRLREVLRSEELTSLVASDDLEDLTAICDDLIVMDGGRVLQAEPVRELLSAPASRRVAELVGYATLVSGAVSHRGVQEPGVGLVPAPGLQAGGHGAVVGHPVSLLAVPAGSGLGCGASGVVIRVRPEGPMHRLELALGTRRVEVAWEWDSQAPPEGSRVDIAAMPGTLRFFPEQEEPRIAPSAPVVPATASEDLPLGAEPEASEAPPDPELEAAPPPRSPARPRTEPPPPYPPLPPRPDPASVAPPPPEDGPRDVPLSDPRHSGMPAID